MVHHSLGANPWGLSLHIPILLCMQVIFIILFGLFTRYDPDEGYRNQYDLGHGTGSLEHGHQQIINNYPMFQDVHVMVFIGFGFLMTFLKKYGLSAVSLNMMISALCIQWTILVSGFLHPHYDTCKEEGGINKRSAGGEEKALYNTNCYPNWPWININLSTLLNADFATATVLITFGVVLGTTSPLQLIIMAIIEIVLFNINEVIGRTYLGAVDAGDTIFVHLFGAYFGLALSRVLYDESTTTSTKAGASRTSDLFSMIGTVFLWMYWPSFNGGAAAKGDAQLRAVINTYISLCAGCTAAFTVSAFVNPQRKFCMEHIQNATLAGGVAIGATADMMVTPVGAMVTGTIAGAWSTIGYEHISPYLVRKFKITDTCGVNNLHGMPAIFGGLLSVLMAAIATKDQYDQYNIDGDDPAKSSLQEIFPQSKRDWGEDGWSPGKQAGAQMAAMVVTLVIAVVGGLLTGKLLKIAAQHQMTYKKGQTIVHLALNIGNVMTPNHNLPKESFFDDDAYFYKEEEEEMSHTNGLNNKGFLP
eukprot:GFUD01139254.1.p1 GENE.GFUD01139254.1~~GFUD01139254.1.p1  ORF type:complete len:531 (+),score=139.87 GFUD01139254.1:95-1687(+)